MRCVFVGILVIAMAFACDLRLLAAEKVVFKGRPPAETEAELRWSNQANRIAWTGLVLEEESLPWSGQQPGLSVLDLDTGSTVLLSPETEGFCWTKGGHELVQLLHVGPRGGSRFFLINTDSGAMEPLLTLDGQPDNYSFSASCERVAYVLDNQLYVAGLGKAARPQAVRYDQGYPDFAIWLGSNELIVYDGSKLCTIDLSTQVCRRIDPPGTGIQFLSGTRYISTSPSGKLIAVALQNEASSSVLLVVMKREADRWTPVMTTAESEGLLAFPLFSPDEKKIAYVESSSDSNMLLVKPLSGGEARKIAMDYESIWGPRGFDWSPDGKYLAYVTASNTVKTVQSE